MRKGSRLDFLFQRSSTVEEPATLSLEELALVAGAASVSAVPAAIRRKAMTAANDNGQVIPRLDGAASGGFPGASAVDAHLGAIHGAPVDRADESRERDDAHDTVVDHRPGTHDVVVDHRPNPHDRDTHDVKRADPHDRNTHDVKRADPHDRGDDVRRADSAHANSSQGMDHRDSSARGQMSAHSTDASHAEQIHRGLQDARNEAEHRRAEQASRTEQIHRGLANAREELESRHTEAASRAEQFAGARGAMSASAMDQFSNAREELESRHTEAASRAEQLSRAMTAARLR